jgi:hypothetical protein
MARAIQIADKTQVAETTKKHFPVGAGFCQALSDFSIDPAMICVPESALLSALSRLLATPLY